MQCAEANISHPDQRNHGVHLGRLRHCACHADAAAVIDAVCDAQRSYTDLAACCGG
jgi:hypothetical protein